MSPRHSIEKPRLSAATSVALPRPQSASTDLGDRRQNAQAATANTLRAVLEGQCLSLALVRGRPRGTWSVLPVTTEQLTEFGKLLAPRTGDAGPAAGSLADGTKQRDRENRSGARSWIVAEFAAP